MATLGLRDIRKSYGALEVVHGVSLDVADGEFVVLIGPSGCGKSTILRMIAGLEDVTAGDILIDGAVVNHREPGQRDVAMVFQDYALYPHLNVAENIGFSLRYRGVRRAEIRRLVAEAADALDIAHLLDRRPRELSGGQRQRVAMGRALVRNPKMFLFDEPLSNLDAKLRGQMRSELKRLRERMRATAIYVTHDQVEAMTLADRIVVLRGGHIEQIGAPEAIYEQPATAFVAGFMGAPAMNLLPCRLEAGTAVLPDGGVLQLPGRRDSADEVWLGIRPESLSWLPPEAPDAPAEFRGAARVVEPLGAETLVTLDVGDTPLHAKVPPRRIRHAGEPVRLRVEPGELHVFARDAAAREAICRLGESIFARGLTFGSSGNISQRIDDGWLLTPTNVSLGALDPARLSKLDSEGRLVSGDAPTKERPLHRVMYEGRHDAAAVVHLHSTHSVAVSCLADIDPADVLPPITAYYVMRIGRLPLVPYFPPGDDRLADAVRPLVGKHHAVLLANHGPVVAGTSLSAAAGAIEELEETARLFLLLQGMRVRHLTPDQVDELRARFG